MLAQDEKLNRVLEALAALSGESGNGVSSPRHAKKKGRRRRKTGGRRRRKGHDAGVE